MEFTADTGAARTILSEKMYQRIPRSRRPQLINATCLTSVNGDPLKVLGKANFEIQLEDLVFRQEIIVADIEDECLLGLDVLLDSQNGPAIIDLSRNLIYLSMAAKFHVPIKYRFVKLH